MSTENTVKETKEVGMCQVTCEIMRDKTQLECLGDAPVLCVINKGIGTKQPRMSYMDEQDYRNKLVADGFNERDKQDSIIEAVHPVIMEPWAGTPEQLSMFLMNSGVPALTIIETGITTFGKYIIACQTLAVEETAEMTIATLQDLVVSLPDNEVKTKLQEDLNRLQDLALEALRMKETQSFTNAETVESDQPEKPESGTTKQNK